MSESIDAKDMNPAGDTILESITGYGARQAFLRSGGQRYDIGTFGGEESTAAAINGAGVVTGSAQAADFAMQTRTTAATTLSSTPASPCSIWALSAARTATHWALMPMTSSWEPPTAPTAFAAPSRTSPGLRADRPDRMKIHIREFEETDRDALRKLYVASRNAAFTLVSAEVHEPSDFDEDTKGEKILVAVAGAEAVGFASILEPESFLHNLFVHPEAMREGVGQALLAACSVYFKALSRLKCLKANVNAMAFYQSNGWRILCEGSGLDGPYFLMQAPHAGGLCTPNEIWPTI